MKDNVSSVDGVESCGFTIVSSDNVTGVPEVWIHEYVIESPSTSELWEPSNVTEMLGFTDWSEPAFATGISLTGVTIIVAVSITLSTVPSFALIEILSIPWKLLFGEYVRWGAVPDIVPWVGFVTTEWINESPSISLPPNKIDTGVSSVVEVFETAAVGGSFTEEIEMETVSITLSSNPSLILNVKLSVPWKLSFGEYVKFGALPIKLPFVGSEIIVKVSCCSEFGSCAVSKNSFSESSSTSNEENVEFGMVLITYDWSSKPTVNNFPPKNVIPSGYGLLLFATGMGWNEVIKLRDESNFWNPAFCVTIKIFPESSLVIPICELVWLKLLTCNDVPSLENFSRETLFKTYTLFIESRIIP